MSEFNKLSDISKTEKASASKDETPEVINEGKSPKTVDDNPPKAVDDNLPKAVDDNPPKAVTEDKSAIVVGETKSLDATKEEKNESESGSPTFDSETLEITCSETLEISCSETLESTCSETLESPNRRKRRQNRRGFYIAGSSSEDLDVEKSKSDEDTKNAPESENKQSDVPKKIVIPLASVKKSAAEVAPKEKEKKRILLKRKPLSSYELDDEEKSKETSSKEPPKKKYKPITWP